MQSTLHFIYTIVFCMYSLIQNVCIQTISTQKKYLSKNTSYLAQKVLKYKCKISTFVKPKKYLSI